MQGKGTTMRLELTEEKLFQLMACKPAVSLFKEHYPKGVSVDWTLETQIEFLMNPFRRYFDWLVKETIVPVWSMRGVCLDGADLSGATIQGVDLSYASLRGTNLTRASLSCADLFGSDLSKADLSKADFSAAYLMDSDLTRTNLRYTCFYRANLVGADLSKADCSRASFIKADLHYAVWVGTSRLDEACFDTGCDPRYNHNPNQE